MQVSVDAAESLDGVAGAVSLGLDSVTVRPASLARRAWQACRSRWATHNYTTDRAALPEDARERQHAKPRDSHGTASATGGGYSSADPSTEKRPSR